MSGLCEANAVRLPGEDSHQHRRGGAVYPTQQRVGKRAVALARAIHSFVGNDEARRCVCERQRKRSDDASAVSVHQQDLAVFLDAQKVAPPRTERVTERTVGCGFGGYVVWRREDPSTLSRVHRSPGVKALDEGKSGECRHDPVASGVLPGLTASGFRLQSRGGRNVVRLQHLMRRTRAHGRRRKTRGKRNVGRTPHFD